MAILRGVPVNDKKTNVAVSLTSSKKHKRISSSPTFTILENRSNIFKKFKNAKTLFSLFLKTHSS
jgi:hypothetical protein